MHDMCSHNILQGQNWRLLLEYAWLVQSQQKLHDLPVYSCVCAL